MQKEHFRAVVVVIVVVVVVGVVVVGVVVENLLDDLYQT